MSYLISGLNIKNIAEYDSTQSYEKYDIVDYQFVTGISVQPSYTGLGQSGLYFWFNNDSYNSFVLDPNQNVSGWLNHDSFDGGGLTLNQANAFDTNGDISYRPYIDFTEDYLTLKNSEFLTGSGIDLLTGKTIFMCVDIAPSLRYQPQNLIHVSLDGTDTSGYLKISGADSYSNAVFLIDDQQTLAVSKAYNTQNIITIIQDTGVGPVSSPAINVSVRQNGYKIGEYTGIYGAWSGSFIEIGKNQNPDGIKYYDIFCFSGILSETEIDYYEKYLFEKYFSKEGLYFAKKDVPANEFYSPLSYTGQSYWTKDINELFQLSYGCSANFSSNLSSLNFGDGYRSNLTNGVNTLNSSFVLKYDGLTDKETKALDAYFENTPEAQIKSEYEGFSGVNFNLFFPYKSNCELYFLDISHSTPYNDINAIEIKAENLYSSSLDYKGMLVSLDESNIRTYSNNLRGFDYHDVVYFDSPRFSDRGYYFYTGAATANRLAQQNNPTGDNSYFTKTFYFKADIDYSVDTQTRLLIQGFKNSTKQYLKDGINYNLLTLDLNFTNRSNREALAILKFLDDKAGFKIFEYTLPQPYNKTINVFCPEWNHTYNFYDNHSISAKFMEYRGYTIYESVFDTKVIFSE